MSLSKNVNSEQCIQRMMLRGFSELSEGTPPAAYFRPRSLFTLTVLTVHLSSARRVITLNIRGGRPGLSQINDLVKKKTNKKDDS